MSANRKPKAWNLKPQLTAAPELWQGCIFFHPGWTDERQIAQGMVFELDNRDPVVNVVSLQKSGSALSGFRDGASSNRGIFVPDTFGVFDNTQSYTIACYINNKDIGNNDQQWIFHPRGERDVSLRLRNDTTRSPLHDWFDGSGHPLISSKTLAENEDCLIVAAYDVENSQRRLYANEFLDTDTTLGTPGSISFDNQIAGTPEFTSNRLQFGGGLYWLGVWSHAFDEESVNKLRKDPFAMLRPAGF